MKLATLTFLIIASSMFSQQADYQKIKSEAEKLYAEQSFAKANELYKQVDRENLPPAEQRWVDYRLADTLWRAESATNTLDSTKFEQAREKLERLVRDAKRAAEQDLIWVQVQESLGDLHWTRRESQNWYTAWPYYQRAFDWWAGQSDLKIARSRYLMLFWKAVAPPWMEPYNYASYSNNIPLEIFENAVKVAQEPTDLARAHFFLATRLRQAGEWEQRQRVAGELEAALTPGKTSDWYDDALYLYAEWLGQTGRITQLDSGDWNQEPDYVGALQLYRRLLTEFKKGETRYYDQAQQAVAEITNPMLGVHTSSIFLPQSQVQAHVTSRNVKTIDFNLYKVNLPNDVRFSGKDTSVSSWITQINLAQENSVRSWSKTTTDDGTHKLLRESLLIDGPLPIGAYVLYASSGKASARELILVSDAAVVLKSAGRQQVVYVCDALSGAPLPNAAVKLWHKRYNNKESQWVWQEHSGTSNGDGITTFELTSDYDYGEVFVSAASQDRQAFSLGQSYYYSGNEQPWRIYAFTDRPAYRPNETVQWKFLARRIQNSIYSTPANQTIEYEIRDPLGNKIKEDKARLNSFGSAWGALELTDKMALGAYQITFYDEGRSQTIGSAGLFRLEEYKLPEFKIAVSTPEVQGRKKAFRLGDRVEVVINAEYYFGGGVNGANVELVVYQNPFHHYWRPARDYPWYYTDLETQRYYGGANGQIIKRDSIKTDTRGKATLFFDTPRNNGQDLEYLIEARVTDSSRREIINSNSVRVTRQRYYVYPRAEHNLYRPNDKVQINIKALDANDQPASVAGEVKVTRDYYEEIWIDESGREIKGDELRRKRYEIAARSRLFPPQSNQPARGWRLKFRGYSQEPVLTQKLETNSEGETSLSFTPNREGYYRVRWTSPDRGGPMVQSETTVWVTNDRTTELGYRSGGLEIIVDKDTFRVGQTAPVMITTALPNRYVLFTVEADGILSNQLLRLNGTSKLIYLPIGDRDVPNIFLNAAMVSDRQLFLESKQVVVPPAKHFLNVEIKPDRTQYQPGEEGTLNITTRDSSGRPVAAEVALALSDSSISYIQQDTAGDPRQFYFGGKRQLRSQVQSTFQQKSYNKLVSGPNNQLMDEALLLRQMGLKDGEDENERLGLFTLQSSATAAGQRYDGISSVREAVSEDRAFANPINRLEVAGLPAAKTLFLRQEPIVQVRTDFRSTAYWQPDISTNQEGVASVKVKYPDSLTSWNAIARVATQGAEFGIASTETRTNKPLMVRLQAPRFFVAGDSATVSAIINNYTDEEMEVGPSLAAEGLELTGLMHHPAGKKQQPKVSVAANGERRIDWIVNVPKAGPVKLKVTARSAAQADAMEREFMAYEHGIEKLIAKSGKLRGEEALIRLDIPRERKVETTALTVQVAPSMAVTMLDALPYLIDYPYGCTEQTLSRFVPAVITAKTLKDIGLSPEAAMQKVFGGIEPATASATHSRGKGDLNQLNAIVRQGLQRLYGMQHDDGGWGWWKEDETDHFMTAYALWGLALAKQGGVEVKPEVMDRAEAYLNKEIVEEENNYDIQAWMLHAMASYAAAAKQRGETSTPSEFGQKAFENLWSHREKLNSYTRALLALSAHYFGFEEQAQTLVRNLENGVKIDRAPDTSFVQRGVQLSKETVIGTAHWGEDGIYYRWSDGGIEATSFALKALLAIDPQNKLVEPVTNWLIKNRRGARWSNTRDTAITILALNDYLRVSGEAKPDLGYEVLVNGTSIISTRITSADALSAPSQFAIETRHIRDGINEIRIRRTSGSGALYFGTQASFFSLEEPIKSAGNELFVRREYYKLVGHPTLLKGFVYERVPLRDGEVISSGERVEVVVTVEAKNNYEYLLFEDLKPAGLEAVQIRSGDPLFAKQLKSGIVEEKFSQPNSTPASLLRSSPEQSSLSIDEANFYTGRTSFVYQELRDRKVALFVSKMPQGVWEMRYSLRAEIPGTFHALPVLGHAMYVPEIRCNDQETTLKVNDK